MLKDNYEVEVLINGKPAKEYSHKGKFYIEGRKGTKFSIRIRNNSHSKKLFVPTVDGLSIMNGEEGNFNSSGYIVNGNSSITIDGWRTSDKEVASFFFSSPEGSYRKKMKHGDNLGIIGVAVFKEELQYITTFSDGTLQTYYPGTLNPWYTTTSKEWNTGNNTGNTGTRGGLIGTSQGGASDVFNTETAQVTCCSASVGSTPKQQLGTGWGELKNSEVTTVNFERVSTPESVFEIRYNTREELEKAGVNMKKEPLYVAPQAFPGNYCKPPQN